MQTVGKKLQATPDPWQVANHEEPADGGSHRQEE